MVSKRFNGEELIETYFDEDSCFIVKTRLRQTNLSVFFFNDKYKDNVNENEFVESIYEITKQLFGVEVN